MLPMSPYLIVTYVSRLYRYTAQPAHAADLAFGLAFTLVCSSAKV